MSNLTKTDNIIVHTVYDPDQNWDRSIIFKPLDWSRVNLEVVLTETCNLQCSHCFGNYGPQCKKSMTAAEVIEILTCFKNAGGQRVIFSGGEPTLNIKGLIAGLDFTSRNNMFSGIKTNGCWGSRKDAAAYLATFSAYNMNLLQVTFDSFHAESGNYWSGAKYILVNAPDFHIPVFWGWGERFNTKSNIKDFKKEVSQYISQNDACLPLMMVGNLIAAGRAKTLYKNIWKPDTVFGCVTHAWYGHFIHVSVETENKLIFNCSVRNSHFQYYYHGDWTKEAERVHNLPETRIRCLYGLEPLLKYRYLVPDALDGCDFCQQLGRLYREGNLYDNSKACQKT